MTKETPNDRPPFRPDLRSSQALAAAYDQILGGLELLQGLQIHITEAIGLIDAGKTDAARAALDRSVVMLDGVDFTPLYDNPLQADGAAP